MESFIHILERFIIHVFSAAGVYLGVYFGVDFLRRRWPLWFTAILPAILVIGFVGWNEVGDLHRGQSYLKVFFDAASWSLGLGLTVWGLIRYKRKNG